MHLQNLYIQSTFNHFFEEGRVYSLEEAQEVVSSLLRMIAEGATLRRLTVLTPFLKCLTLDGSDLTSLRELGTELVHLTELHVSHCGLNSLDGVFGTSKLEILHAAANNIIDVFPLVSAQQLQVLNLQNNLIKDGSELWPLSICPKIKEIFLKGCPASEDDNYRQKVADAIPSLVYLDGVIISHSSTLLTLRSPMYGNIAQALRKRRKDKAFPSAIQAACELLSTDLPQPPLLSFGNYSCSTLEEEAGDCI